jgi:tetratricopeptide (TPR) repeat protein
MLTDYLEGALEPVVKAACEVHLISCDKCRGELAMFMRALRADVTPEEARMVQAMSEAWDKRTAPWIPPHQRRFGTPVFVFLSAVAGIALIGFLSVRMAGNRAAEERSPQQIVQLLLEQDRPFEARLSNEPHLPLDQRRSAATPNGASGLIEGRLLRLAAGPYDMGRFYLAEHDLDSAIRSLERAAQDPGALPEVHNDLGVAYMEHGGEANLKKAEGEFRRALDQDAKFAPAVFNLSLLYERTDAEQDAEALRSRYLNLDPDSGWANEVRSKLQAANR